MEKPTKCAMPTCNRTVRSSTTEWCSLHLQRVANTGSAYRLCMKCKSPLPEDNTRTRICDTCMETHQCSVDGCNRPPQGRGYCKMHWKKWRKYGDPLGKSTFKQIKGKCSVDGCESPYHANGYCASHGYHAAKYGDPLAKGPGKHSGRNRMDVPSYAGIHKRLFYDRGRASQFDCVDCGNAAEEWSYDGGAPIEHFEDVRGSVIAYTVDQSYYSPRCKKCHRKRDLSLVRARGEDGRFIA